MSQYPTGVLRGEKGGTDKGSKTASLRAFICWKYPTNNGYTQNFRRWSFSGCLQCGVHLQQGLVWIFLISSLLQKVKLSCRSKRTTQHSHYDLKIMGQKARKSNSNKSVFKCSLEASLQICRDLLSEEFGPRAFNAQEGTEAWFPSSLDTAVTVRAAHTGSLQTSKVKYCSKSATNSFIVTGIYMWRYTILLLGQNPSHKVNFMSGK